MEILKLNSTTAIIKNENETLWHIYSATIHSLYEDDGHLYLASMCREEDMVFHYDHWDKAEYLGQRLVSVCKTCLTAWLRDLSSDIFYASHLSRGA